MGLQRVVQEKIGELLIDSEKLTQDQLNEALEAQKNEGGILGEILVSMGHVTEDEIVASLAIQYEIPYLAIRNYDFDEEIFSLFPRDLILDYHCLPLDQMGKVITVAVSNPLEVEVLEKIEEATGCQVQCFICKMSDLRETVDKYFKKNEHAQG